MTSRLRLALLAVAVASCPAVVSAQSLQAPDTVTVRHGAMALRALVWRPEGVGRAPAILFSHGSGPTNDPAKAAAIGPAFARHGYVFMYLYRRGAGLSGDQGTNSGELMARAFAERGDAGRNEVQLQLLDDELTDVQAGLAVLRSLAGVQSERVAVAGHSFGGMLSLLLAARDTTVAAVVAFGPGARSWDRSPELRARLVQAAGHIASPTLFVFAANDYSVAPGNVLSSELRRHGRVGTHALYEAVGGTAAEGHDLVYSHRAIWEQDVFAFLDAQLRVAQRSAR